MDNEELCYYTYMLRCIDNSIYTGMTKDLDRRMEEHFSRSEKCAKYTLRHHAKELECAWKSSSRELASKLEYYIKKLSKAQKEELIKKNNLSELMEKVDEKEYKRVK